MRTKGIESSPGHNNWNLGRDYSRLKLANRSQAEAPGRRRAGAAPEEVAGAFRVNVRIPTREMRSSKTSIMVTVTDAGRFVGAVQDRVTVATR
jgi:hypothetical protein